jgi:hypothetical protein
MIRVIKSGGKKDIDKRVGLVKENGIWRISTNQLINLYRETDII